MNENNPAVHGWSGKRDFLILGKEDGLLYLRYKVGKHHVNQLVVPAVLVPAVLSLKHDNAGHMGPEKTTNLIRREYHGQRCQRVLQIMSCLFSQSPSPFPAFCTLYSYITTTRTLAGNRNGYQGSLWKEPTMNRYVLVVVDLLTRAAEMIPIPDKSAKTVASARALIRDVFCRRGIPESILTDRGCEFDNQALSTIAQELGIDKKRISPLHPQANGIVERLNRTIGEMLRKTTDQCGKDWDLEIPLSSSTT